MSGTILPQAVETFVDANGKPLAGGSVYMYIPNTTTFKNTYQDPNLTILNTNPIILNASGQAIIWGTGQYRQQVFDQFNNLIWDQITEDTSSGLIGNFFDNAYLSGPGFTPGVTTQLTLSTGPGSATNMWVFFDSAYQTPDTWSLSGTTVTFTSAIPVGVNEVNIKVGSTISIGTPGNGTVTDMSVAANANIQSSKLAFIQAGSGAVSRTVQSKLREEVSVVDFGADPTGILDSTAAMAAAWTYVSAAPQLYELIFPAGIYKYSSSPNFGVSNATVTARGQVVLNYTGTGNAVIIDSGATGGGAFNVTFGKGNRFIIQAPSTAQNGLFSRAILQGSYIGAQINGAGTTFSGALINFSVAVVFDIVVSNNVQGGTFFSKPQQGIFVTQRNSGELTSYCTFINPVMEGTSSRGIYLDWAQGNSFIGGTSEGNSSVGVYLTANAIKNKFFATDFEANPDHDVYCLGNFNEFYGINTNTDVTFDGNAKDNSVIGGTHQGFLLTANTFGNIISHVTYNQNLTGATINDVPNKNVRLRNRNNATSNIENVPLSTTMISVGASPFTFTNNTFNEETVYVAGGNITFMTLTHGGGVSSGLPTNAMYNLSPGDALQVTYMSAPTMNLLTR